VQEAIDGLTVYFAQIIKAKSKRDLLTIESRVGDIPISKIMPSYLTRNTVSSQDMAA
jgi:hypothetical protein